MLVSSTRWKSPRSTRRSTERCLASVGRRHRCCYLAKARVGGSALPRALDSGDATLHQLTRCLFLASVIPTHRDGQPDTSSTLVQRNRTPSATCPGTPLAEPFQRSPVRVRALWWGRPAVAGADARIRMRERSHPKDRLLSFLDHPAGGRSEVPMCARSVPLAIHRLWLNRVIRPDMLGANGLSLVFNRDGVSSPSARPSTEHSSLKIEPTRGEHQLDHLAKCDHSMSRH